MSKSRKNRQGGGRARHISVRAVRRDPPDLRKLSRALIELALAQAEADAETQARNALQAKPVALSSQDEVSGD